MMKCANCENMRFGDPPPNTLCSACSKKTKPEQKEMSLEEKAKEYAIKVHGYHVDDKDVRDNLEHDYKTIYKQALKDLMERVDSKVVEVICSSGLRENRAIRFNDLGKIAEELTGEVKCKTT